MCIVRVCQTASAKVQTPSKCVFGRWSPLVKTRLPIGHFNILEHQNGRRMLLHEAPKCNLYFFRDTHSKFLAKNDLLMKTFNTMSLSVDTRHSTVNTTHNCLMKNISLKIVLSLYLIKIVQVGWAVQLVLSIDRFIGAVQWSHDNPELRAERAWKVKTLFLCFTPALKLCSL